MNESDETLEQLTDKEAILQAIDSLSKQFNSRIDNLDNEIKIRIDDLEKSVNTQFEVIREGIVHNSAKFDRLEAKLYDSRSDISNLRADIKEMTEMVLHRTKGSLV